MNVNVNPQAVGDAVRKALADAATSAVESFAGAAALAVGDVAMAYVGRCVSGGAQTAGESVASAYALDVRDRVVASVDSSGIQVGDIHVTTQLARFAAGDPAVRSPVGTVAVEHTIPIAIPDCGKLETRGTLTLHAEFSVDETTDRIEPHCWAKFELTLGWTEGQTGSTT